MGEELEEGSGCCFDASTGELLAYNMSSKVKEAGKDTRLICSSDQH